MPIIVGWNSYFWLGLRVIDGSLDAGMAAVGNDCDLLGDLQLI